MTVRCGVRLYKIKANTYTNEEMPIPMPDADPGSRSRIGSPIGVSITHTSPYIQYRRRVRVPWSVCIYTPCLSTACASRSDRGCGRPGDPAGIHRIGPSIARHIDSTRLIRTRAHRINTHVGLSSLHRTPSRRATHTNRRAVEVESAHCRVEAAGIDRGSMRCGKARGEKAAQALCPTYIPSEARSPQDRRSQHE